MDTNDPTTFAAKVTGFTDGEGHFGLSWVNKSSHPTPVARFRITLRSDDYMIAKIMHFFGCGGISSHHAPFGNRKPARHFTVSRIDDLNDIVIPHFETWVLESKKERDFAIWKQAVRLIRSVVHRKHVKLPGHYTGWKNHWAATELAEFESLRLALKEQRRFESSDLIIPTPTNGKASPQGLLFEP